jgi:hypothetical protein
VTGGGPGHQPPYRPAGGVLTCPAGYMPAPDGSRCKSASSVQPRIMFSNRYYIRLVDLQGNSEIFAKNQSNAVALGNDLFCQFFFFCHFKFEYRYKDVPVNNHRTAI